MKKILLFVAGLMLAMSASAAVYLRGNGDWGTPAAMQFTDNGDGTYTLDKAVTLTSAFKIGDESWGDINYGSGETAKIGTISVVKSGGDIKVTNTIEASKIILDTNALTLTIEGADGGAIEISTWTLCGVGELVGDAWDPASTANVMTESNGVYTLTKEGVSLSTSFVTDAGTPTEAPGYGYKVAANAQWGISAFPDQGNQFLTVDADGIYNVTFTWDPASEILSATATLVSEGGSEGGEEGGDQGGEEGGEEGGDDPIVTPTGADYYLIGWINNADYGDKEDWENLGDYKFVDGSLVATFEADSYVAIKTGDLAKWYFAEAYAAGSPVTLAEGKGFAEKMFVPGGVEVTFTLVENGDGSLTLSYTTSTTTGIEDIDAEDAVIAAYDLLGRPVAADAAGYVILQYASGKAAKVFNY